MRNAQLVWSAKPNSQNVETHSLYPEAKLFNAIFSNDEAKKRVKIDSRGCYRYQPSQEYSQYYCRMKLNLKK